MTSQEFDSLRLNFMWKYSDICYKMVQKMQLGADYNEEFYKLLVLNGYLEIFMEYVPEVLAMDERNFFSREDMAVILEKTNELCDTSFYVNFILE